MRSNTYKYGSISLQITYLNSSKILYQLVTVSSTEELVFCPTTKLETKSFISNLIQPLLSCKKQRNLRVRLSLRSQNHIQVNLLKNCLIFRKRKRSCSNRTVNSKSLRYQILSMKWLTISQSLYLRSKKLKKPPCPIAQLYFYSGLTIRRRR